MTPSIDRASSPETKPADGISTAAWTAAALLFAFGLVIRLTGMRASLWLDEFSTLWAVEARLGDVLHRVPQVMGQSPFFYVLAWLSVHTFGESEAALRLPTMIAVVAATLTVGLTAGQLGGRRAALWASLLFWLSNPAIGESVDARPYGLSLFFAALAVYGFSGACRSGRVRDRALWIVGAAGLVWAHYIFAPFLAGLAVTYVALPSLRRTYTWRRALVDAVVIILIVVPAGIQVAGLFASRASQRWLFAPIPWAIVALVAPFVLAAWFPVRRRAADVSRAALRASFAIAIVLQIAALMVLYALGFDLLEARYAVVVVVAAAVLAGDRLGELTMTDTVAPVAAYALVAGLMMAGTRQIFGSFSGAGFQEWRQAVAALRPEVESAPHAPVLFRSGNAEDDLGEPGHLDWPATLAPLRSPGEPAPDWNIALLTYRWNSPARAAYFDGDLAARIEHQPTIFLLCLRSAEAGSTGYCSSVEAWIAARWPAFHARSLGDFRSLAVVRLDR